MSDQNLPIRIGGSVDFDEYQGVMLYQSPDALYVVPKPVFDDLHHQLAGGLLDPRDPDLMELEEFQVSLDELSETLAEQTALTRAEADVAALRRCAVPRREIAKMLNTSPNAIDERRRKAREKFRRAEKLVEWGEL